MTPDERKLLQRTLELAEENNTILRKMRTANRWGRIIKILYWAVIILLSFGAYYLIQPYVDYIRGIDDTTTTTDGTDASQKPDIRNLNDLLNALHN